MHEMTDTLLILSSALLLVFAALSAVDGVYIHLARLRLHAHAASWTEHVWHTGRAVLFAPILLSLFTHVTGGALLWAGIALLVVDQALELLDTTSENESRAALGGLGTFEYVLHVFKDLPYIGEVQLGKHWQLWMGSFIVLVVVFAPRGVLGIVQALTRARGKQAAPDA